MKRLIGLLARQVLWLWAWLSHPKDGNKNGLP